jgi:hypothetical protein
MNTAHDRRTVCLFYYIHFCLHSGGCEYARHRAKSSLVLTQILNSYDVRFILLANRDDHGCHGEWADGSTVAGTISAG